MAMVPVIPAYGAGCLTDLIPAMVATGDAQRVEGRESSDQLGPDQVFEILGHPKIEADRIVVLGPGPIGILCALPQEQELLLADIGDPPPLPHHRPSPG